MSGIFEEALKRAFQRCMFFLGGRGPPKKAFQTPTWTGQGFGTHFQPPSPDWDPFLGHIFRFSAQNSLNRLELGQTKAINGFPTLKIGAGGCQPLGPASVDPKARLPCPAVGTGPRRARARVLTLGSTPEPTAGPGKGAFGSTKMGPVG